jgi:predicted N-formylglutamate amidohydrolase
VPKAYRYLFAADPSVLTTHRGYDIGIAPVARQLAARLDVPLTVCRTSRLLIEPNRSLHHRSLFSPSSRDLPQAEKLWLIEHIWRPHRQAVAKSVASHIRAGRRVLHLALHSFTPILKGCVRTTDLGLLYDPQREAEKNVALSLQQILSQTTNLRIRRNYPYRGSADGLTTTLRRTFTPRDYLGLEIELNQAVLASGPSQGRKLAPVLANAIGRAWPS